MQGTSCDLESVPYNNSPRRTFNWFFFESPFKVLDGFKLKLCDLLFILKKPFKLASIVSSPLSNCLREDTISI